MADDTSTTVAAPAADSTAAELAATADDSTQPDLGEAGKKALAAERAAKKAAEKQVADLAKRLQEFEDRDKSEAQKLAERAEAAEKERDALRSEALRARVALTKGLPAELADRLRGATEEEMAADADSLLALIPAPTTRPRGDVDQGARSTSLPVSDEMEQKLRALLGG